MTSIIFYFASLEKHRVTETATVIKANAI